MESSGLTFVEQRPLPKGELRIRLNRCNYVIPACQQENGSFSKSDEMCSKGAQKVRAREGLRAARQRALFQFFVRARWPKFCGPQKQPRARGHSKTRNLEARNKKRMANEGPSRWTRDNRSVLNSLDNDFFSGQIPKPLLNLAVVVRVFKVPRAP